MGVIIACIILIAIAISDYRENMRKLKNEEYRFNRELKAAEEAAKLEFLYGNKNKIRRIK